MENVNVMPSSSKKPRMDEPAKLIDVTLTDFKEIATDVSNMLVDKTELIYIFRKKGRKHELITAPPRFGKSVNLTMFRCFFGIEVDPITGKLKTKFDPKREPVTDTENYRLFKKLNLAIMNYEDIVKDHFGRHPVLYVNFKSEKSIKSVDDALELCRSVVHRAFNQHEYLCVSEKLTDKDKALCKNWCSDETYKRLDPRKALKRLADFLYMHFEREVVFLVDEYDSLVATALVEADRNSVEDYCKRHGIDDCVANELFEEYDFWVKESEDKYNITPDLVRALINKTQQTRDEICSANGIDVNVGQELADEYKKNMAESWRVNNLSSDYASRLIKRHENRIEEICKKPVGMIAPLLKTDDMSIHLLGSLVTGISYIAGIGWSGIANNIIPSRFTQRHNYNQFYGFQLKEIEDLCDRLGKLPGFEMEKNTAIEIMTAQYNGYERPGPAGAESEKIYCPWSVLNYLIEKTPKSFWAGAAYTEPLNHMFHDPDVRIFLLPLLEDNVPMSLSPVGSLAANDLIQLKKLMKGNYTEKSYVLFLNFILELGYLTIDASRVNDICYHVKIPNLEVKVLILKKLKNYYSIKCSEEFKDNARMKSAKILNCINLAARPEVSDGECAEALLEFKQDLQTLFQQYSASCLPIVNESGLHCFMAEIFTTSHFVYFVEHYILDTNSNKRRLDVLGYGNHFGLLVELKYFPTSRKSAIDALNQIVDNEYFNAFQHPVLLQENIERTMLMGISVNKDKKISTATIRNYKKITDSPMIFNISFDE